MFGGLIAVTNGITILGTGGDSSVVGRQLRASGGFVVTTPQTVLHFDPGPGALIGLAKNECHPRETTAVVLSHFHVNHASEAAALISAMTHNGIDKRGVLVMPSGDTPFLPEYQKSLLERHIQLIDGQRVAINDTEIRGIKAHHYDAETLGYIISTPDYIAGYTADAKYSESWAKNFVGCNILVINCRFPDAQTEGDHLCTDDVVRLVELVKPQLAVLTHFGSKMLSADPLAQARFVNRETKVQTIAAKDGLHIAPASYNAKKKQQSLKEF